jgi:hypothetical protein
MKKFKLNTPCLIDSFKEHKKLKNTLVSLIKDTNADCLNEQQGYYSDLIHRLDWSLSNDKNRKWVKYIIPSLQKHLEKFANKLGYQDIDLTNIWFQQYNKDGKHGWHTHAENYTGVYYVQFSNKCAKTELIDPFSQNKKIIIDAKEGDIVIFPSYVIHRATEQKQDLEKIIISFNLNFTKIIPNIFDKISIMKGKKI